MRTILNKILFFVSVFLFAVSAVPLAYSQWIQTNTLPNAAIHGFGTIGATLFVGTEGGIFLPSDKRHFVDAFLNDGFAGGIAYSFATIGSSIFCWLR